MNTSGQWITIDMDSEAHDTRKTSVILVCGQTQNNDVILFGIGKIDLTLEYHGRISLFGKIEQDLQLLRRVKQSALVYLTLPSRETLS